MDAYCIYFDVHCCSFDADAQDYDFVQWQSTNIQLLHGKGYKLGADKRTIATLEHAHSHTYGDNYLFVDWTWPDDGKPSYNAEFSPRLSLGKVFDADLSMGIVKDVLIATTLEKPKNIGPRYLYGLGVDLNIPNFRYFKANAYVRDDTQLEGETWQLTLSWNRPFDIGNRHFILEGFADIAGGEGATKTSNQLIVPRFLMDVGDLADQPEGKLFAGIEYSYWHNKLGNEGVTESVPQLQVKWVF